MFAIIISEKGGPERREAYDKSEINVGRVQGNDLMLPKGNVSKHHARLLFRDGRFIVTDLKSTNGTYVNGKKIAQATVVREGDKIFIGDFVIRLEGAQEAAPPPPPPEASANDDSTLAREAAPAPPPIPMPVVPPAVRPALNGPAVTLKASTHPPGARPVPGRSEASAVQPAEEADDSEIHKPRPGMLGPRQATMPLSPSAPLGAPPGLRSHSGGPPPLPSEIHTPGHSAAPVAGPPALSAPPLQPPPVHVGPPPAQGLGRRNSVPPARPEPQRPPLREPGIRETRDPREAASRPAPAAAIAPAPAPAAAPPPAPAPAAHGSALAVAGDFGKTEALVSLASRVGQVFDLTQLRSPGKVPDAVVKRAEGAVRDAARAMSSDGSLPDAVDAEALSQDLLSELIGLGPVTAMFEDDEVVEIHAQRFDRVLVGRGGRHASADVGFSSEEGLVRIVERLCELSGEPRGADEVIVDRALPNGATVFAVLAPLARSSTLSVRKRRASDASFDSLAREGALSRPMAVYLEALVAGRMNVLVIGAASADAASFLGAFVHASPPNERVAVVEDHEELSAPHACVASFRRSQGAAALAAAARTRPDRLVVSQLGGAALSATFEAMGDGCEAVVAALTASSLRAGLARLAAQLVFQRPGLSLDGARELIAESFDAALELGPSTDGRRRVVRVCEVGVDPAKGFATKDIFVLNEADGTFPPSGVVPKAVAELNARGARIDAAIFRRGK
ncbi:MAG: Flp pilus assembly complex ATPase component TadA [Myxococcales bacterium]|nr:Flp pilus assembly complex ATPase component TadA [Myxococcales bacterium]MBL0194646.1 Flp pilus assembly complex ATPase component TadA [Myxococcales bacterium]